MTGVSATMQFQASLSAGKQSCILMGSIIPMFWGVDYPFWDYMSTVEKLVKPKFGRLMRKIRLKKGKGVRELARELVVDHTYISQVELGKVGPPVGLLSMKIARILDSPELMKLAEWITVRQLLIVEMNRHAVYHELPDQLRNELGITDAELKEITDMCSRLTPKLLAAKDRRESPSEWKRSSRKEEGTAKRTKEHSARSSVAVSRRGSLQGAITKGRQR
jgi:transcriptional regulator with XRE-family HTH domain